MIFGLAQLQRSRKYSTAIGQKSLAKWRGLISSAKQIRMAKLPEHLGWTPLKLHSVEELRLEVTLRCGQSFRWKKQDEQWIGVINSNVFGLRETPHDVEYRVYHSSQKDTDLALQLADYLQLHIRLVPLFEQWSHADKKFKEKAPSFVGLRLLRQDPLGMRAVPKFYV